MEKLIKELDVKFAAQLKELGKSNDTEMVHVEADDLLLELLGKLGFSKVLEEFEDLDKWYA